MTTPLLVVYSGPRDLVAVVGEALDAPFVVRWVPAEDDAVAKALRDAGHVIDTGSGRQLAMTGDIR